MSALNIGGRVDPMPYHPDSMQSGLGDLFMSQQPGGMNQPFGHQIPPMPEFEPGLPLHMHSQPFDIPQPNPRYSTQHEQGRGAALSPVTHLTTLDVPLPASFDSQEPSNIAKYGRIAASVPSKFGIDSPPHSLPKKSTIPADTLRNLHDSVFTREAQSKPQNLGTSPSGNFGGNFGQRPMFSSRIQKPKQLSCSLPEWEDEDMMFGGEEDYIPEALSHLLNDQERTRRNSAKVDDPLAIHESLNGSYTPAEFNSKVGSPSTASPSRYSALFKEQSGSNFGHVGSPLRPSPMHLGSSPGVRAGSRASSSELAFQISSPPRKSNMSALSQQLQQTRLSGEKQSPQTQNSAGLHPIARRHVSNPRTTYDRAVSSSSVNTNRIEEEQTDFVFSLDEEDYSSSPKPSPWASKPITLGSIGDGRIGSLNGENGKSRAVTMPPRK